jgi:glutamate dehydrogenase/leucine dehydrogenase
MTHRDKVLIFIEKDLQFSLYFSYTLMADSLYTSLQAELRSLSPHVHADYAREFEQVLHVERLIEVSIPVVMDSGKIQIFTGYRSQHSSARGPYKGWVRYHQNVTRDEVMALSAWMSIKTAVLDLPLGWAKWGITVDVSKLSSWELERLSRGWVDALYNCIWPNLDIPAPDVNTNPQIMGWFVDEYAKLSGRWQAWAFTGKPLALGGSLGRDTATAQGWVYVLEAYLSTHQERIKWKKVVIQGCGNAGLAMMKILSTAGAKIIGVSDSHGGIYNAQGINIEEVSEIKKQGKSLKDGVSGIDISNTDLLELECDILIPAALEWQITIKNASSIQALLILELANWPITPEADEILFSQGITIIPDILANAWGVTVSYFEQVQNATGYPWSREEVASRLKYKMETALHWVMTASTTYGVPLRKWAYIIALQRILEAVKARGI